MTQQLSFWPMDVAPGPEAPAQGRIVVRDEGGSLVRVDMYTADGSSFSVGVPRPTLLMYGMWLIEAGVRAK